MQAVRFLFDTTCTQADQETLAEVAKQFGHRSRPLGKPDDVPFKGIAVTNRPETWGESLRISGHVLRPTADLVNTTIGFARLNGYTSVFTTVKKSGRDDAQKPFGHMGFSIVGETSRTDELVLSRAITARDPLPRTMRRPLGDPALRHMLAIP